MNLDAIGSFLSEETVRFHLELLRNLKLKYSIFEKSYPEIRGLNLAGIMSCRPKNFNVNEILPLIISIKSHEMYFDSFSLVRSTCHAVKKYYSSQEAFLYDISCTAEKCDHGFVYITFCEDKGPLIFTEIVSSVMRSLTHPVLALDMCEHAYFLDYGFNKAAYISQMIQRLDITKIFSQDNSGIYLDTPI